MIICLSNPLRYKQLYLRHSCVTVAEVEMALTVLLTVCAGSKCENSFPYQDYELLCLAVFNALRVFALSGGRRWLFCIVLSLGLIVPSIYIVSGVYC